jgi:hypothetical protein
VVAWGNGLTFASPNLPKGLRMGAVLSVGWLRAAAGKRLGAIVTRFVPRRITKIITLVTISGVAFLIPAAAH